MLIISYKNEKNEEGKYLRRSSSKERYDENIGKEELMTKKGKQRKLNLKDFRYGKDIDTYVNSVGSFTGLIRRKFF